MKAAYLAPLLAVFLLGGCVEDSPDDLSPAEEAACEARGGYLGWAGFSGVEFCAEPTPDAGQMCSAAPDCAGYCDAESRTCSTHFSQFGCYSFLDDTGQIVSICVD